MPVNKWSKIPYGAELEVQHNVLCFKSRGGCWKSVQKETGLTAAMIIRRYAEAYGGTGIPKKWIFHQLVTTTSQHPDHGNSAIQGVANGSSAVNTSGLMLSTLVATPDSPPRRSRQTHRHLFPRHHSLRSSDPHPSFRRRFRREIHKRDSVWTLHPRAKAQQTHLERSGDRPTEGNQPGS